MNVNRKVRVFVAEEVSAFNKGEAAILWGLIDSVRRHAPLAVSLCTDCPEVDAREYGDDVELVHDNVPKPHRPVGMLLLWLRHLAFLMLYTLFGRGALRVMRAPLWRHYVLADVIIYGHDNRLVGLGPLTLFWPPVVARVLGKPSVIFAGTVGPFRGAFSREMAKFVCRLADRITLREKTSVGVLRRFGIAPEKVTVTADAAFLMEPASPDEGRSLLAEMGVDLQKPIFAFTMTKRMGMRYAQSAGTDSWTSYMDLMASVASEIVDRTDGQILLIGHCRGPETSHDDLIPSREMADRARRPDRVFVIESELNARQLKAILGQCDLLVGHRTHSLIAASSMATPVVPVSSKLTDSKTRGILGDMLELESCIIDVETLTHDRLLKHLVGVWEKRETWQAHLKGKIIKVRERAMRNGEAVAAVVQKRPSPSRHGVTIRQGRVDSLKDVVSKGLCLSCGSCVCAASGSSAMVLDPQQGVYYPSRRLYDNRESFEVCPGKGCELVRMHSRSEGPGMHSDPQLGPYYKLYAARSCDPSLFDLASSGGVMTEIPSYLLDSGQVDGVLATRLAYTPRGPRPEVIVARSRDELLACRGSKYLPVPLNAALAHVRPGDRLAYCGTPCQIHGLRQLQERGNPQARQVHWVIGNFCGGFRSFLEMETILSRHGMTPSKIRSFRFRGGGQPGSLRAEDSEGRVIERPYPDYTKDTGYKKPLRCRLCPDGTAELADFSCGDAWLDRFHQAEGQWSLVVTRTHAATEVFDAMVSGGRVETQDVSLEEVRLSQKPNLTSKKVRQTARRVVCGVLGIALPRFDGGYENSRTRISLEARIMAAYAALRLLEDWKLYPYFKRFAKWGARHIKPQV